MMTHVTADVMEAAFSITVDPARDFVVMRLSGFFTLADLGRFEAERRVAFARLRCGANQHRTLVDTSRISVQTQGMVTRFGAAISAPAFRARRIAFITASSLARSQLQRAIGARDARVFTDEGDATEWLFADVASAAA